MRADEMRVRFAEARCGYLATSGAGPGARPHVVPICFAVDGDRVYSAVDWKPKRDTRLRRMRNVEEQPLVSLLVDGWDEDWSRLWWIRLDGLGSVLPAGPEASGALGLLVDKYSQYRLRPPEGPVLRIAAQRWSAWSAAGRP